MEVKSNVSFLKQLSKALAAGVGTGALFYILGAVASTVSAAITPEAAFAVGFAAAVAISLGNEE